MIYNLIMIKINKLSIHIVEMRMELNINSLA